MASYNKVILAGNLTRDPQLSTIKSGTAVCEFGLAINRLWKDQSGEQKEDVCFIDCKAFSRSAETIAKYVTKGSCILVEGRLQFDQWQRTDGNKQSKHTVVVESFQFLDPKGGEKRDTVPTESGQQAKHEAKDSIPF